MDYNDEYHSFILKNSIKQEVLDLLSQIQNKKKKSNVDKDEQLVVGHGRCLK